MSSRHKPLNLQELRSLRKPVKNINVEHSEKLSKLEKIALFTTEKVGTMGFFIIICVWTILWIGWNILAPYELRFDPFPAFVLWLFISNTIQLFLTPLIMVGQNLQNRHTESRAEADFEINTKSERELETIIMHLENQNELLSQALEKLEEKKK
ncbi:MAG: DUF1003 domain-containing protein [Patescibacteria group bacterium]